METRPSTVPVKSTLDDVSEPTELTGVELTTVAGGLNPQPLPPFVEPEMRV